MVTERCGWKKEIKGHFRKVVSKINNEDDKSERRWGKEKRGKSSLE